MAAARVPKRDLAASKLVRDIGDVYSKLFNHHGPIQREVNFYVQEFETKRRDREVSRLNQACVNCSHIETLLPEVESLSRENVQTVLDRTKNAIQKANAMLDNKLPEENVEKVEERRNRMENEWKTFEEKTNSSREVAEQCHVERMQKLKEDIQRINEEIKGK
jgi:DNA repair exonuclease SbcCD ATPase subunit